MRLIKEKYSQWFYTLVLLIFFCLTLVSLIYILSHSRNHISQFLNVSNQTHHAFIPTVLSQKQTLDEKSNNFSQSITELKLKIDILKQEDLIAVSGQLKQDDFNFLLDSITQSALTIHRVSLLIQNKSYIVQLTLK